MIIVFLHVLTMFAAVTATFGSAFLAHRAIETRHVPTIRAVFSTARTLAQTGPILFVVGLVLGLTAIFTQGLNPFRPWLLIAYVLFAIAMGVGARIHAPYARSVGMAAEASPESAPSPELNRAMDNPLEEFAYWLDYAIVVAIIFDMIVKPFGL